MSEGGQVLECSYCHTRETPVWRLGPKGAKTLCNACGIRWKRNKQRIRPPKKGGSKKAKSKSGMGDFFEEEEEEDDDDFGMDDVVPPSRRASKKEDKSNVEIDILSTGESGSANFNVLGMSPAAMPLPKPTIARKRAPTGGSEADPLKKKAKPSPRKQNNSNGAKARGRPRINPIPNANTTISHHPVPLLPPSLPNTPTTTYHPPPNKTVPLNKINSWNQYVKHQSSSAESSRSPSPSSYSSSMSDTSEDSGSEYSSDSSPSPIPQTTVELTSLMKKLEELHQAQKKTKKRIDEMNGLIASAAERASRLSHNGQPGPDLITSRDDPDSIPMPVNPINPISNINENDVMSGWNTPPGGAPQKNQKNHFNVPTFKYNGHSSDKNAFLRKLRENTKTLTQSNDNPGEEHDKDEESLLPSYALPKRAKSVLLSSSSASNSPQRGPPTSIHTNSLHNPNTINLVSLLSVATPSPRSPSPP